MTYKTNDINF